MLKRKLLASVGVLAMAVGIPAHASIFDRDVTTVESLSPSGESFTAHLAREYRTFSLFESRQMFDWPDADHFAEKAMMANNGTAPSPERPGAWNIDDPVVLGQLKMAREQLVSAMNDGAATLAPREAAVAQAKYDCWVEQQEEGWQHRHIAACKRDFDLAMEKLTAAMTEAEKDSEPNTAMIERPKQTEIKPIEPLAEPKKVPVTKMERVYFEFDSSKLTDAAERRIAEFASGIADKDSVEIVVTGHADRSGPADYNMKLSSERAQSVRDELIEHGLTISELEDFDVRAAGESSPAVPTADGVREPANRRVVLFGVGYAEDNQLSQLRN